jgi:hypothetical protein
MFYGGFWAIADIRAITGGMSADGRKLPGRFPAR